MSDEKQGPTPDPVLRVRDLCKHFPITSGFGRTVGSVKAVDGVSFDIFPGKTLGLVGESGCGKSTTGRTLLRLIEPSGGTAEYKGTDLFKLSRRELHGYRRHLQMVFQDPRASLDPKLRVGDAVAEPMAIHKMGSRHDRKMRSMELLEKVGLRHDQYFRYPHEFSGGQRQRIGVARALAVNPDLIICDEPVSALDVSIQSQVINLLEDIQEEFGVAYVFIAHDLGVVRHIADEIGVMYLGHVVEKGPAETLFSEPKHPYTRALLSSIPQIDAGRRRERIVLSGELPSPADPPSGCVFHTRCPLAMDRCSQEVPAVVEDSANHTVACHLFS